VDDGRVRVVNKLSCAHGRSTLEMGVLSASDSGERQVRSRKYLEVMHCNKLAVCPNICMMLDVEDKP
jgi:hypothetical protein